MAVQICSMRVQPQRLPSCLLETNTIRRLEPLSIAEAMERLLIPAVCVRGESSPTLTEIVCCVLVNNSRGIIGGHLSVDSSLLLKSLQMMGEKDKETNPITAGLYMI